MSNGSQIGGIVGAGINILALGLIADTTLKMLKDTQKQSKRTNYKGYDIESRIKRMI
jgi:hypothetical protein